MQQKAKFYLVQVRWVLPLNLKGKTQGVGAAVPPSVGTVMHRLSLWAAATVNSSTANTGYGKIDETILLVPSSASAS